MTITEFLLARIAEDEALMRDCPHMGCYEDDADPEGMIHGPRCPARVLAECAAKRAIVELAAKADEIEGDLAMEWPRYQDSHIGDRLLAALASVHADHPDYDPSWA